MNLDIGRRHWAISAGHAPARGTGSEPVFTSHDRVALLNAGARLANVRITVFYADRSSVGPYRIGVAPRRVRSVRINDLIFPEAVRLGVPYGLRIDSDERIVAQFTRQDTRARALAGLLCTAWAG
jgi:hypothetical protein